MIIISNEATNILLDKKCNTPHCDERTELNEGFCLKCEKLIDDANYE